MVLNGLYSGQISNLPPDGERSAIVKHSVQYAHVTLQGLSGDQQADKRVHGGPERALHQFAVASYAQLAADFPSLQDHLQPGMLGENLSVASMDEGNVLVGDRYAIGDAVIEVTQPRSPCWKIDHKLDHVGVAAMIAQHCLCGWYYRVLQPGRIEVGDKVSLEQRYAGNVSIAKLLQLKLEHRPSLTDLTQALESEGLGADWQRRLQSRYDFLAKR